MNLGKHHILKQEPHKGDLTSRGATLLTRVSSYQPANSPQSGAYFVEAALVTPLVLLITFASFYFCILAAKNFALQSFATDIARDVSLALQTRNETCGTRQSPRNTVDISVFKNSEMMTCWRSLAQTRYPIGILNAGDQALDIVIDTYPITQWYDATPTASAEVGPGDLFNVSVRYPSSNFLNGRVPFLGTLNFNLEGTAVGVIEKP